MTHETIATRATDAEQQQPGPLLRCDDVTKYFGSVCAVDGVSMDVRAGSVIGLVGDNGAGKSTLIRIISGLFSPDLGSVIWDGEPIDHFSPTHMQSLGIQTVHQNLLLCENLGPAENIHLGHEPVRFRLGPFSWLDTKRSVRDASERLNAIGATVNLGSPVRSFSGGQRQAIALARALERGCRLVILDEPTAALGVRQTQATLELVRRLRDQGLAIILISHNLDDVLTVADRLVGLRLGRVVLDTDVAATTKDEITRCMVG